MPRDFPNPVGAIMQQQTVQKQAEQGVREVQAVVQSAIDHIPPEQWPLINTLFKITIVLAIIWIVLALIAWWRRSAYNLTVASTADRSKKAQPDFLNVNKEARGEAIERGDKHEDDIAERERKEALAALNAGKQPLSATQRLASAASFLMSLFTLLTAMSGAVLNVGAMGDHVSKLTTAGKLKYLIYEHTFGCLVVLFVIGYHIWKYFHDRKWQEAK
jgi:hypothetical protein